MREFFSFFLHPHQTWHFMPRKGWSSLETPAGWYQVIRGPRPKAVQWPRRQWWSSSSWWTAGWPVARVAVPKTSAEMATRATHTRNQPGRGHGGGTHEGSAGCRAPSTRWATASQQKLSGWEKHSRKPAEQLRSDQWRSKVEECQAFLQRSRNRLARLEQEVAGRTEGDGKPLRFGLTRLREEMMRAPFPGHERFRAVSGREGQLKSLPWVCPIQQGAQLAVDIHTEIRLDNDRRAMPERRNHEWSSAPVGSTPERSEIFRVVGRGSLPAGRHWRRDWRQVQP